MKALSIAVLLGAASPTNLDSIWDEDTQFNSNLCTDPYARWKNPSNSWSTYKNAYLNYGAVYEDNDDFGPNF